jgi:hypothetical protein
MSDRACPLGAGGRCKEDAMVIVETTIIWMVLKA